MRYYRFADFKVLMHGENNYPYIIDRCVSYETDAFDDPDMVITLEDVEFIPLPEREPFARSFMLRQFYRDSEGCDIYVAENGESGACSHVHSDLTWSHITVKTSSAYITGIETDFFTFQILWDAVRNFIASNGGIVLHSSAISYNGEGILFSAASGTGKSTHTQLWKKLYPESVEFVNDDTPAIFFKDNVPYMYGLPWSGKGENKNMSVPLKSVVFLERSIQNAISVSDVDSSVFHLLEQTYRSPYIENLDESLKIIEKIIYNTDVYLLGANMNDDAAVLVKETVFGK